MLNRENGLEPELDSYTALLGIYGEAGDMEAIMSVCEDLSKINFTSLSSFNLILFFFFRFHNYYTPKICELVVIMLI